MKDEEIYTTLKFLDFKLTLQQFRKIMPYVRIEDIFEDKEWITFRIYLTQTRQQISIKITDLERS